MSSLWFSATKYFPSTGSQAQVTTCSAQLQKSCSRTVGVGMVDRLNKYRTVVQEATVYAQCETVNDEFFN